ncbi:MAG: cupin domain-containing protein [Conexibacter sp.]
MIRISATDGFASQDGGFRRRLFDDGDGPLRAYAFSAAAHTDTADHCHARSVELFFAVKGHGTIVIEGQEVTMFEGDTVIVEPGEYHFVRTASTDFQLLCVVAPNVGDLQIR